MKKQIFYNLILAIAVVICLVFLFNFATTFLQGKALDKIIFSELSKNKISKKDLVDKVKHVYIEKRYWISDSFSVEEFNKRLQKSLEKNGFQLKFYTSTTRESIVKGKKEQKEEISYLISKFPSNVPIFRLTLIRKIPLPKVTKPKVPAKAKVAIVLDDWGYNVRNLADVLLIDTPLTLAILPNLRYSTTIAKKAKGKDFEVILHMPMEPKNDKIRLELNTLYKTMNEDEIRAHLAKALRSVPNASGISNHEGSKATEDEKTMRAVFRELKKQNLYFLDSLVTNESVCEPLSGEMGIKFAQRSIFLDNEDDPAYIKKQFEKLQEMALKTGDAVGIGHDRTNTIIVLKEMIPKFEESGIEFIYLSEIAR